MLGKKASRTPRRPFHTFSIVSRDPNTGIMGVAVQSHWFSVGSDVCWAEAGVGVVATQAFADPSYGPKGLVLMRQGMSSREALEKLAAADKRRESRQIAMVDAKGQVAVRTGARCTDYAGHRTGNGYSVQANLMLNDKVPDAMARAFEITQGQLEDRLMAALEAAQNVGGDIRGKQSAAMLVVKAKRSKRPWSDRLVDLRVDDNPEPLRELRRLLDVSRSYAHANAGDVAMEKNDFSKAIKEYREAMRLAGDNLEISFWTALTLATKGKINESLPIFKKVFSTDSNWVEVLRRLPKSGLITDDATGHRLMERIVSEAMK